MKIDKVKDTYGDYKVVLTFGQLKAIQDALQSSKKEPVSDELLKELEYYMDKLPKPGEDEDEDEEGGDTTDIENTEGDSGDLDYLNSGDIEDELSAYPDSDNWGEQSEDSLDKTANKVEDDGLEKEDNTEDLDDIFGMDDNIE